MWQRQYQMRHRASQWYHNVKNVCFSLISTGTSIFKFHFKRAGELFETTLKNMQSSIAYNMSFMHFMPILC